MRDRKRDYELLFIVSPLRSSEEEIAATVERVAQSIAAVGGSSNTVQQTAPWGRRKFAYNSDHMESGHYINFQFTAEPSSIEKIKGRLRLNNQIHLQYYQRA